MQGINVTPEPQYFCPSCWAILAPRLMVLHEVSYTLYACMKCGIWALRDTIYG